MVFSNIKCLHSSTHRRYHYEGWRQHYTGRETFFFLKFYHLFISLVCLFPHTCWGHKYAYYSYYSWMFYSNNSRLPRTRSCLAAVAGRETLLLEAEQLSRAPARARGTQGDRSRDTTSEGGVTDIEMLQVGAMFCYLKWHFLKVSCGVIFTIFGEGTRCLFIIFWRLLHFYMLETKGGYLMAGTLAGWPGQVVRVRAVSRAGDPSRAQVTLGAGRPEMGGSVREYH